MTTEDREELRGSLRAALFHLASCWDQLGAAEGILGPEIETDDISCFAGNLSDPSEAFSMPDDEVDDMIDELMGLVEN
jgi:hypothetical protein